MKDLQYITHDLGARNDPKLLAVQMEMGGQGLAIFWCLVEMLWENDGRLPMNFRAIAFSLRWATAEEVERVIKEFGLFEDDGEQFWSRSALERIAQKKDRIQATSDARRNAANMRWQNARNANAMQMQSTSNAEAMPINKDINIDRKKDRDNNRRPTAADVFDLLFFENVKDPSGEAARFLKYYDDNGWAYTDGTPVADWEKAARAWKPLKGGKRHNDELLRWYRAVWNAAKDRLPNAREILLKEIDAIKTEGGKTVLRYRTEASARAAAGFILDNDLAGDWKLDFRVAN